MPHEHRRSLSERMKGAALFKPSVYKEVEADTDATGQAALVVAIVAIAAAIGGARGGTGAAIVGIVSAFLGWVIWSAIAYWVGTRIFNGTATWDAMLRTIGFAQSPGVLYAFGIIPIVGWVVEVLAWFWILIAVLVAIRQTLDFGTGRALLTAAIGFVPYLIIAALVRWFLGIGPAVI